MDKFFSRCTTTFPTIRKSVERDGVIDLEKDQSGNIWMLQGRSYSQHFAKYYTTCYDYNINIIDPLRNQVRNFSDYINSDLLKEEDIIHIKFIGETIYLLTTDHKLYSYTDELIHCCTLSTYKSLFTINQEHGLVHIEDNTLNQYDFDGQLIYSLDSGTLSLYDAIIASKKGKIFFLKDMEQTVKIFEFENGQVSERIELPRSSFNPGRLVYNTIEMYSDGSLLVTDKLHFPNEQSHIILKNSGSTNEVYEYLITDSRLNFIATNLGVYVIDKKKDLFHQLASSNKEEFNSVRGIIINENIEAYRLQEKEECIFSKSESIDLEFIKNKNLGVMTSMHYLDPKNEFHLWSAGYIPHGVRRIDLKNKQCKLTVKIYSS